MLTSRSLNVYRCLHDEYILAKCLLSLIDMQIHYEFDESAKENIVSGGSANSRLSVVVVLVLSKAAGMQGLHSIQEPESRLDTRL